MRALVKTALKTMVYVLNRFWMEGYSYRAASLAYTSLMAIVPVMMIGFSILSFFPVFHGVADRLQQLALDNFVADSATTIVRYLNGFIGNVKHLPKVTMVFLIFVGLLIIYNMNKAFNAIWNAKPHFKIMSLSFLIYFLVLVLSPLLLGAVMLVGDYLFRIPAIEGVIMAPYIRIPVYVSLPYLIVFITFTLFNWILPTYRVRLLHAVYGGLFTTVLFELAKYVFGIYITQFSNYRVIYGALGIIPGFLIWLYISWVIILIGGLLTNAIADKDVP